MRGLVLLAALLPAARAFGVPGVTVRAHLGARRSLPRAAAATGRELHAGLGVRARALPRAAVADLRAKAEALAQLADTAELQAERAALEVERLKLGRAKLRAQREAELLGLTSEEAIAAVQKRAANEANELKLLKEEAERAAAVIAAVAAEAEAAGTQPASGLLDGGSKSFWEQQVESADGKGSEKGAKGLANRTLANGRFSPYGVEPTLDAETIKLLRDTVINPSGAFAVRGAPEKDHPLGTFFRGDLKGGASSTNASTALLLLEQSLKRSDLKDKVQLFLTLEPEPTPEKLDAMGVEGGLLWNELSPVVMAVRKEASEELFTTKLPGYANVALVAPVAVFTSCSYALSAFLLQPGFVNDLSAASQPGQGDLASEILSRTLPLALAIGGLQLFHDLGHTIAAARSGVKLGVPIQVPSLQLGLFGTIMSLKAHPRDRSALFDTALAGPAAGFLASISALAYGLALTAAGPGGDGAMANSVVAAGSAAASAAAVAGAPVGTVLAAAATWPTVPVALLKSSSLVAAMTMAIAPETAQGLVVAQVHPLVIAGLVGVTINALNLLPIGRIDGGRLSQAVLGPNVYPRALSAISLLAIGVSSLLSDADTLFFFGLYVAVLQGRQEVATLDELTPVGPMRSTIWALALTVAFLVLVPLPSGFDPNPTIFTIALGGF